ncbi:MAG TPA: amino acid permease C-terminal domain-containing protein, partial [Longimicrobiales bacterium]
TPFVPAVPILGIAISLLMMLGLPLDTWIRLVVWLVVGMVVYATYGRRHSRVQAMAGGAPRPQAPAAARR